MRDTIPHERSKRSELTLAGRSRTLLAAGAAFGLLGCGGAPDQSRLRTPSSETHGAGAAAPQDPLPPEVVLFALRPKQAGVEGCFEREAARGVVRFAWVVEADGSATQAAVLKNTTGRQALETCLLELVHALRFETQPGPARASWTFVRGIGNGPKRTSRGRNRAGFRGSNTGVAIDQSSPGRLPIGAIENVAQYGYRLYAFCVREGIYRDSGLHGRVLLQFTIDPDGRVDAMKDAGSNLPDLKVIDCVAEAFYALEFPAPEGGALRVSYPILVNEDD